jgi:hypothetical protein
MAKKFGSRLRVEVVYGFQQSFRAFIPGAPRTARLWGSDALRLQLKESIVPHLPENIELNFSGLAFGGWTQPWYFRAWLATRRPAVYILLKNAAYGMSPDQVSRLRQKAIAVGVDHKDGDLADLDPSLFDFHISSSMAGARALERIIRDGDGASKGDAFVGVLFQGCDARLNSFRPQPLDKLAPVYVGARQNAAIPDSLRESVSMFAAARNRDMAAVLKRLPDFNFHYAVRPQPSETLRRCYKPFTKGANAAACFSNILVNREADDALDFLGEEYPYLLRSSGPGEVEDAFERARDGFGGPEWRRGLEIMRAVRERLSPPALARQFNDIVTRAAS